MNMCQVRAPPPYHGHGPQRSPGAGPPPYHGHPPNEPQMRGLEGLEGLKLSSVAAAMRGLEGIDGLEGIPRPPLWLWRAGAPANAGPGGPRGPPLEPRCGRQCRTWRPSRASRASSGAPLRPPCGAWRALRPLTAPCRLQMGDHTIIRGGSGTWHLERRHPGPYHHTGGSGT